LIVANKAVVSATSAQSAAATIDPLSIRVKFFIVLTSDKAKAGKAAYDSDGEKDERGHGDTSGIKPFFGIICMRIPSCLNQNGYD